MSRTEATPNYRFRFSDQTWRKIDRRMEALGWVIPTYKELLSENPKEIMARSTSLSIFAMADLRQRRLIRAGQTDEPLPQFSAQELLALGEHSPSICNAVLEILIADVDTSTALLTLNLTLCGQLYAASRLDDESYGKRYLTTGKNAVTRENYKESDDQFASDLIRNEQPETISELKEAKAHDLSRKSLELAHAQQSLAWNIEVFNEYLGMLESQIDQKISLFTTEELQTIQVNLHKAKELLTIAREKIQEYLQFYQEVQGNNK